MNFLTRLKGDEILILDGAMGTELSNRGVSIELPLWSASAVLKNPEVVEQIHKDYIRAGADIITTNTFRTTSRTFLKAGLSREDAFKATKSAVEIARSAVEAANSDRRIWIAGSISPLEDCYHPELFPGYEEAYSEHSEKAQWLYESGVDFILIETMNSFTEALAATNGAILTGLPVITSFILISEDKIINGDDIYDAYLKLKEIGISAFSINCTHYSIITKFLNKYSDKIYLPLGVYANSGIYDRRYGWIVDPDFSPENYADTVKNWAEMGVKIVGGCCGTSPEHIMKIKTKLASRLTVEQESISWQDSD